MFSVAEKRKIAEAVEKVILELDHPEMPKERPDFFMRILGKESWSWAEIKPNWMFNKANPPSVNPWNEKSREMMGK